MATKTIVIVIIAVFIVTACTIPKPIVRTDEYHEAEKDTKSAKALNGLQMKALKLMNLQEFDNAIQYLQRAIKIEPRNPLNWHYLAQNYWHLNDFSNCRAMIQRAISYSQFDADLNKANETLLKQCTR